LKAVSCVVNVPEVLIENGEDALNALLPKESATKEVDLALLSLIYPYNIVSEQQRNQIIKNVENFLVREKGVVRYCGDKYYANECGEAVWTMGFPWLAIIYKQLNDFEKYNFYVNKSKEVMNSAGELPELYYANSCVHNENTPLAWSMSLLAVAEQ